MRFVARTSGVRFANIHAASGTGLHEFDAQARRGFRAARQPNLTSATLVGRGFDEGGLVSQRWDWLAQAAASARFLAERFLRP